jgi:tetratricopeptide (TPR) repeat protein
MEVEPTDFSLYFAEGTLHDRLNNFEEAEKSYKKSIELNSEYYDALFNLGALYFNAGVELLEQANKVPAREVEKYDELIEKSNVKFRLSIPYIERAYEVTPQKAAIETLRNLYFRFRNDSEEMQMKYDKIDEIWNNLEE